MGSIPSDQIQGGLIERRYGSKWKGITINYLSEEVPMGTLWSLKNIYSSVDLDMVLRNGDTICESLSIPR